MDPLEYFRATAEVKQLVDQPCPVGSLSESLPHPTFQSKDIIITYVLILLNLFKSNIDEHNNLGFVSPPPTEEAEPNSALRILSSLFTVIPRSSESGYPSSSVKVYEKWARGVLESVIWFNSLAGEDIECLNDVQTEGAPTESLLKVLRLAVKNIPKNNTIIASPQVSHNMAVIVISNLLTSTFSYQGAFTRLSSVAGKTSSETKTQSKLKYDARLRSVIRQLSSVLITDTASGVDTWEQEKTRSFMQQRIEQSVVVYMLNERKKERDMKVRRRKDSSSSSHSSISGPDSSQRSTIPRTNSRKAIRNLSISENGSFSVNVTASSPGGRTSVTSPSRSHGRQIPAETRRSTITAIELDARTAKKPSPGLKVETQSQQLNVMDWLATPLSGMSSIISNINSFTSQKSVSSSPASPVFSTLNESEEEETVVSPLTLFGITSSNDALFSFQNENGLKDWFFKEVQIHEVSLHVVICVSGLLGSLDDVVDPWQFLPAFVPFSDIYSLGFHTNGLLQLNSEIKSFILTSNKKRKSETVQQQLAQNNGNLTKDSIGDLSINLSIPDIFSAPHIFPTPPSLLDTWNDALLAAQKAGEELGKRILLKEAYGKRPITLAGFGLGARVIYYALLEVVKEANTGEQNVFSLIDSVYLITAPVISDLESWTKISSIVAGRIVNAYSTKDTVLTLFQSSLLESNLEMNKSFIGMGPISGKPSVPLSTSTMLNYTAVNHNEVCGNKVENVDCSDLIKLHIKTETILPQIMERIGFERSFGDTRAPVASASPAETNVTAEPTPLVEKGAPFRKNTLSKLVIPSTPVKQESVPLQFDTLFDANVEFLGTGELVETPELLTANTDFFVTPTSAQISKDIIYEPEALLLTPLSRPGSNKTLDEDEEDREQAKAWISSGLEGRFF